MVYLKGQVYSNQKNIPVPYCTFRSKYRLSMQPGVYIHSCAQSQAYFHVKPNACPTFTIRPINTYDTKITILCNVKCGVCGFHHELFRLIRPCKIQCLICYGLLFPLRYQVLQQAAYIYIYTAFHFIRKTNFHI